MSRAKPMDRVVFLTSSLATAKDLMWQLRGLANRGVPVAYFSRGSRIKKIVERPTLLVMDPFMASSSKGQRLIRISKQQNSNVRILIANPVPPTNANREGAQP